MASEVRVKITADDRASAKLDQVGKKGTQMGNVLKGAFVGAGIAAGAFAAVKLAGVVKALSVDAVGAASNFEESLNKVRVVFGPASDAVEAFAADATRNILMTEAAALEAAGTFGNLITSLGGTQDAASEMSTGLVALSADLSSFNNIGTAEALVALRSGLVGEIEPLRRLGVSFNAADVEARALALGLADTKIAITEADKVSARYSLILDKTTNAQGDAARTAEDYANSQKRVQKAFGELQVVIGERLLPVMTDLSNILAEELPAAIDWVDAHLDDAILLFQELWTVVEDGLVIAGQFLGVFFDIGVTIAGVLVKLGLLSQREVEVNEELARLVAQTQAHISAVDDEESALQALIAALVPSSRAYDDLQRAIRESGEESEEARAAQEAYQTTTDALTASIPGLERIFVKYGVSLDQVRDRLDFLNFSTENLEQSFPVLAQALRDAQAAAAAAKPEIADLGNAAGHTAVQMRNASAETIAWGAAMAIASLNAAGLFDAAAQVFDIVVGQIKELRTLNKLYGATANSILEAAGAEAAFIDEAGGVTEALGGGVSEAVKDVEIALGDLSKQMLITELAQRGLGVEVTKFARFLEGDLRAQLTAVIADEDAMAAAVAAVTAEFDVQGKAADRLARKTELLAESARVWAEVQKDINRQMMEDSRKAAAAWLSNWTDAMDKRLQRLAQEGAALGQFNRAIGGQQSAGTVMATLVRVDAAGRPSGLSGVDIGAILGEAGLGRGLGFLDDDVVTENEAGEILWKYGGGKGGQWSDDDILSLISQALAAGIIVNVNGDIVTDDPANAVTVEQNNEEAGVPA